MVSCLRLAILLILLPVCVPYIASLALSYLLAYLFGFLAVLLVPAVAKALGAPVIKLLLYFWPSMIEYIMHLGHCIFMTRLGKKIIFTDTLEQQRAGRPVFRPFTHHHGGVATLCVPVAWDKNICYLIRSHSSPREVMAVDPADSLVVRSPPP